MPRRILVLNPNTSPEVTDAYLAAARAVAPERVIFTGVTGRFGARIVSTEAENVIAAHSALELAAEHGAGHDALILAISFDTGLSALRSVLPMPVIGITEAALHAAATGGRQVGVIFFGEVSHGLYESVLAQNGFVPTCMAAINVSGASDYLAPEAKDAAVRNACLDLHAGGAEAVVILGAAIVGMAARLTPELPLPIFDGIEAVRVAFDAPATKAKGQVPLGECRGLSPALARLIRGDIR